MKQARTKAQKWCGVAALLVGIIAGQSAPAAERIVSMNLCTDHLVWALADHENILSLSFNSTYPEQSLIADDIAAVPINHGSAEEILPLEPDIVFTSNFTTPFASRILRDRGFSVVEVPMALTIDDIRSNTRMVASALGEEARGEALLADFDARLAEWRAPPRAGSPSAVVLMPGGFTAGSGTLANDLLSSAGLRNAIAEDGVAGWANLSIERFLSVAPDVVILGAEERAATSMSTAMLAHPAMRRFMHERRTLAVPSRLWSCGTVDLADALESIRAGLETQP